jgi:hypothetical protein
MLGDLLAIGALSFSPGSGGASTKGLAGSQLTRRLLGCATLATASVVGA